MSKFATVAESGLTPKEAGKKLGEFLMNRSHRSYGTSFLETAVLELKDDLSNIRFVRAVLNTMVKAGYVRRDGEAKFTWIWVGDADKFEDSGDPFDGHEYDGPAAKKRKPRRRGGAGGMDDTELATRFQVINERCVALERELRHAEARINNLEGDDTGRGVRVIEVRQYEKKPVRLKDAVVPKVFDRILALASMRRNILLVGPAGCGKTTVAELVAESLGLKFGKIGGSGGLSETDLLGRHTPNLTGGPSRYEGTAFVDCYEGGGLCLVDELDGADQNVLLALNPALDRSGKLPLPKRSENPLAKKHADFVCVATANTFGRGATRQYAGRNQLDEATLDRFRIGIVEMYYDETIEAAVCPDDPLRRMLTDTRKRIEAAGLRRIVSTRFMEDAYVMTSQGGWSHHDVMQAFFEGWTKDEKEKIAAKF